MDSTKKFRFAGVKMLLTYPGHLNKPWLIDLLTIASNQPIKFIRCAHEIGKTTGVDYDHTHCLIRWVNQLTTTDCRRFDVVLDGNTIHPNIAPIRTETHWRNQIAYIAKEDPDNSDLIVRSCVPKIWGAESLADALADNVKKPADTLGVIALYNARPAAEIQVDTPDRPWQLEVLDFVQTKPDRRSVHWYYDPKGGAGKTWLARYMMANKLAYMVKQCGGSSNFATIMAGAVASGWDQRCFILDLPRSAEDYKFYGCLEEICDGCVTATKYQGGTILFNQPHVLVFANFLPNRSAMSADRWVVHWLPQIEESIKAPPLQAAPGLGGLTLITLTEFQPPKITRCDNVLSQEDIEEVLNDLL